MGRRLPASTDLETQDAGRMALDHVVRLVFTKNTRTNITKFSQNARPQASLNSHNDEMNYLYSPCREQQNEILQ